MLGLTAVVLTGSLLAGCDPGVLVGRDLGERKMMVRSGDRVVLDATGMLGGVGGVAYSWKQLDGPTIPLQDPSAAAISFTAPAVDSATLLVFKLKIDSRELDAVAVFTVAVIPKGASADGGQPVPDAGPGHDTEPAPVCGDQTCDASEDCGSCASDCGACGPVCGDQTCDASEDCQTCSTDCGACPGPGPSGGIWIGPQELAALPTSGSAWDRLNAEAASSWGSACLHDNGCSHDVSTLAGALVAARTNDAQMRAKVVSALQSAMGSSLARSLELSRGLQSYVIAADIIDYRDASFKAWVRDMVDAKVSPHSGGSTKCNQAGSSLGCSSIGGILCTALRSPNNWGGHARASVAAAAVYLGDSALLDQVAAAHRAFIGLDVPNHLHCNDTTWHADSSDRYGINKKGAQINGTSVSGVLPEDWRRADYDFNWPPATTGYMWEGMQGLVVTAVILHRAGVVSFADGDNAIVRAMDALYGQGENAANNPVYKNPAEGDDTWIPWVVNHYANTSYPTSSANSGKGMGFTDWTHGS